MARSCSRWSSSQMGAVYPLEKRDVYNPAVNCFVRWIALRCFYPGRPFWFCGRTRVLDVNLLSCVGQIYVLSYAVSNCRCIVLWLIRCSCTMSICFQAGCSCPFIPPVRSNQPSKLNILVYYPLMADYHGRARGGIVYVSQSQNTKRLRTIGAELLITSSDVLPYDFPPAI
jgi:hypothetical protein